MYSTMSSAQSPMGYFSSNTEGLGSSLRSIFSSTIESLPRLDIIRRLEQGISGDAQRKISSYKAVSEESPQAREEAKPETLVTPTEMLAMILNGFGLRMTDLEKVLGVTRATLYNWRKGGYIKGERDAEQLCKIYAIAKAASDLNSKPLGKRARTHFYEGKSLLSRLCADILEKDKILAHMEVLAFQEEARLKARMSRPKDANDIDNVSGSWQQA